MNWVQRKIYLYNVTFGLYMLDWWERCLFRYYCACALVVHVLQWDSLLFSTRHQVFMVNVVVAWPGRWRVLVVPKLFLALVMS